MSKTTEHMLKNGIKPAIKPATVKRKRDMGLVNAGTTLVATGLLADSIKSRKGSDPQSAEVYVEDRRYGGSARVFKSKRRRFTWKHETKRQRGMIEANSAREISTVEVAYIHETGMPMGRHPGVKRSFFFVTQEEFDKSMYLRMKRGIKNAVDRCSQRQVTV